MTNKPTELVPTQADRDAAERFGSAWSMNAAGKFGLANLLAAHRLASPAPASEDVQITPAMDRSLHNALIDSFDNFTAPASEDEVERVSALIREHHRTYVRLTVLTNEPRRTFHQGDRDAAKAIIAALRPRSEREEIVAWLRNWRPALGSSGEWIGHTKFVRKSAADAIERGDFKEPSE